MVTPKSTHPCWICGNDVLLEKSKTDEHGKVVHEECYAVRVALEEYSSTRKPTLGTRTIRLATNA